MELYVRGWISKQMTAQAERPNKHLSNRLAVLTMLQRTAYRGSILTNLIDWDNAEAWK